MKTINLNDYVWVELTKYGWQSLAASYFENSFAGSYSIPEYLDRYKKETAPHTIDGVERTLTRFQLHDFMLTLGCEMFPGNKNVVENNNLYFDLEK